MSDKTKKRRRTEVDSDEALLSNLIGDFTGAKQGTIMQLRRGKIQKNAFMEEVSEHIRTYYSCSDEVKASAEVLFEQYIFGYSRLTPLIKDAEISDIRCVSYNNIRIKKKGIRKSTDIQFKSEQEYKSFIEMIATKNQVNISNLNAIQRFSDNKTDENFILRFTVCMPAVNTYDEPYLHIRKVPRNFPEIEDLIQEKMMSRKTADIIISRFRIGSTLICGGNSSGKTTLLNALKETLPEDKAVLVVQQADELTTKHHPEMQFMHSLPGTGESQVSYDLNDISIAGLTMDVDYFIVGEIKGEEAKHILKAAYSGQICSGTVHAPSAETGPDKIVDYSMYETRYSKEELMQMMSVGFRTVIFMKGYKVQKVVGVKGWDNEKKVILYESIFERGET